MKSKQMVKQSAEGAECNSLGQRPRSTTNIVLSAEGAEFFDHGSDDALSALGSNWIILPRALPWAITFRAFGALIKTPELST
jgi:hypothetical protein